MDGVRVISSVAVFLFVLLASFSAAREERSTRATGWGDAQQADIKSLVLLEPPGKSVGDHCVGSITSEKTVLTYCAMEPKKAYAGLVDTAKKAEAKQIRDVGNVVPYSTGLSALKICILKDKWELKGDVVAVKLPSTSQSLPITGCTLLGYGASGGKAQKLAAQSLAACTPPAEGELCTAVTSNNKETHSLRKLDLGGPAVCGEEQQGINKEFKADGDNGINVFINIVTYSDWIEEQKTAAEAAGAAGETDGTGGTGGNGTASSGYSIHSHLNKYSNWKVLCFLVPPIVTFLQY